MKKLLKISKQSRKEILKKRPLHGYCYQNCRIVSKNLKENNIDHDLCVVGIIEDYIQGGDYSKKEFVKASKHKEYQKEYVPETYEELLDSWQHFIILAYHKDKEIVVDIYPELRDESLNGIIKVKDDGLRPFMYIGEWPHTEYLNLKDSILDKEKRFDHF